MDKTERLPKNLLTSVFSVYFCDVEALKGRPHFNGDFNPQPTSKNMCL